MLREWSGFSPRQAAGWPGAGAAGGVAFGLAGFAGAKLVRGTPAIMKALRWQPSARKADVIFTGEGRLDKTSFQGKVIGDILERRGRAKVIAVVGSSTLSYQQARRAGLEDVILLKEFS